MCKQMECCAAEGATEYSVGPFTYRSPPWTLDEIEGFRREYEAGLQRGAAMVEQYRRDRPVLTPAIRAFLRAARDGQWLLRDTTRELVRSFGLSAEDAGKAIADDVREQA